MVKTRRLRRRRSRQKGGFGTFISLFTRSSKAPPAPAAPAAEAPAAKAAEAPAAKAAAAKAAEAKAAEAEEAAEAKAAEAEEAAKTSHDSTLFSKNPKDPKCGELITKGLILNAIDGFNKLPVEMSNLHQYIKENLDIIKDEGKNRVFYSYIKSNEKKKETDFRQYLSVIEKTIENIEENYLTCLDIIYFYKEELANGTSSSTYQRCLSYSKFACKSLINFIYANDKSKDINAIANKCLLIDQTVGLCKKKDDIQYHYICTLLFRLINFSFDKVKLASKDIYLLKTINEFNNFEGHDINEQYKNQCFVPPPNTPTTMPLSDAMVVQLWQKYVQTTVPTLINCPLSGGYRKRRTKRIKRKRLTRRGIL